MPDWIAHLMLGWGVAVVLGIRGPRRVIFLVGNVLPDLVRILVFLGNALALDWFSTCVASPVNVGSHSLLGVVAYSFFVAMFFKLPSSTRDGEARTGRWQRWLDSPTFLLFLGGIFHLFLDTFMWPWAGGIPWLFPLMDPSLTWSFQATWPGSADAIMVLLPFVIIAVVVEIIGKKHHPAWFKNP